MRRVQIQQNVHTTSSSSEHVSSHTEQLQMSQMWRTRMFFCSFSVQLQQVLFIYLNNYFFYIKEFYFSVCIIIDNINLIVNCFTKIKAVHCQPKILRLYFILYCYTGNAKRVSSKVHLLKKMTEASEIASVLSTNLGLKVLPQVMRVEGCLSLFS